MKKIALIFLMFYFTLNLFSQDLERVDKIIVSYQQPKSVKELANRINYDFKTKIEKIRAIYTWIALNIEYITSSSEINSSRWFDFKNFDTIDASLNSLDSFVPTDKV